MLIKYFTELYFTGLGALNQFTKSQNQHEMCCVFYSPHRMRELPSHACRYNPNTDAQAVDKRRNEISYRRKWKINSYYHFRSTLKRDDFFAYVYFSNVTVSQASVSSGPMKMRCFGRETNNVCQTTVA